MKYTNEQLLDMLQDIIAGLDPDSVDHESLLKVFDLLGYEIEGN